MVMDGGGLLGCGEELASCRSAEGLVVVVVGTVALTPLGPLS